MSLCVHFVSTSRSGWRGCYRCPPPPTRWLSAGQLAPGTFFADVTNQTLLVANREGFNFREQLRSTPTIDDRRGRPVWNHDQLIRQNIIVLNRDAQVWGWFDVKDGRHWPGGGSGTSQAVTEIAVRGKRWLCWGSRPAGSAQTLNCNHRDCRLVMLLSTMAGSGPSGRAACP